MKYNTGFIVALNVDETFLESHSLMLVSWQKGILPSNFLRNVIFGMRSKTVWLHSKRQTTGGENNFLD